MRRDYHRWTDAEHQILRESVGLSLRTIRRRLGRPVTVGALKRRFYVLTGRSVTDVVETQGMTQEAVAQALCVTRQTVRRWCALATDDQLPTEVVYTGIEQRKLIKPIRLIIWIKRGLLPRWGFLISDGWRPTGQWGAVIADTEQTWRASYISSHELRQMMARAKQFPLSFPPPDIRGQGQQRPNWWKRDAVRQWLVAHPHYITTSIRQELKIV